MAPSIIRLGAAALAYASSAAALEAYQLKESYTPSNFFEKFKFFSESDPNRGFVKYRNQQDAAQLNLTKIGDNDVTISVDSTNTDQDGRSSVRLESVNTYSKGLFIADFAHFPKQACGAWPAFWMVGPTWPRDGEVDIYEGWNLNPKNKVVLHTDDPNHVGSCVIQPGDFTSTMVWANCWNNAPGQPGNTGCAVDETNGLHGNPNGGVYATEWQEDRIRVWSWPQDQVPANVRSANPDPSKWGKPSFAAGGNTCDVKRAFNNMRMVLNINFCGDAAGGTWGETCKSTTKTDECYTYVQWHPEAFKETYWKIRGINVYQLETVTVTSTSTSSTLTSTSTSSTSTSTSSSVSSTKTSTSTFSTEISTTTSSSSTSTSASSTETSSSSAASTGSSSTETLAQSSTTASETVTPSSSTETATETETESDCPDDISTSATATQTTSSFPDVTSTSTNSFPDVTATTTSATSYTTSTIFTTSTFTITSCAPAVTNCPARTVTSVIAIGTTVCPVTEASTSAKPTTTNLPSGWTVSTIYTTKFYTITSCPPSVTTGCPGRETMTVIPIGTTVCPVDSKDATTTLRTSVSETTTIVVPRPSSSSDEGDKTSSSTVKPSFGGNSSAVPSPSSIGYGTEGVKPSFVVPPVEVVTTSASTSAPAASKTTGAVKVSGAGKNREVVGGGLAMVFGAVVALVM
ncbi:glycoside hydrolase family 16 protein [Parathielavia appendiculata]|uniref:Glycoside hydrolase family 16 protein n=1 Tax=Parathielavia appendiculata TaxID=2587402 RepID=A0AAN6TZ38_9PEZI|nr:glycoside hydrolase family 16 protein [Parathielavia appendiculata]